MIVYKLEGRFDPITGKPVKGDWCFKEFRCDFSGRVIDEDDIYATYRLNYNGQDDCFGASDDEFALGRDYNLDMHQLLSQEYMFCNPMEGEDDYEEMNFIREIARLGYSTIEAGFRDMRVKTVRRLIKSGELSADEIRGASY